MNIENTAALAMLSEAAYADFRGALTPSRITTALQRIGTDDGEPDDPTDGFSVTQSEEFVERWEVVHHQPDTESGFSATLFKSTDTNAAQPYVLAIRGTYGEQDLIVTDGSDIVLDGLAIDQIVDLWNYWKKLVTPKGQNFVGSELITLAAETTALLAARAGDWVPGFNMAADAYLEWLHSRDDIIIDNGPGYERVRTIQQIIPAPGNPEFSGALDTPLTVDELAAVTGHSLGGHLSAALTRLVSGIEALTVNGAGFTTGLIPGVGGDAEVNVRNLFAMLGGDSEFDSSRILNLHGDKMPEFVTQNSPFGLVQQGGHEAVFIEQDPWYGNTWGHGSGQMTDSLAVYDLLIRLDANIAGMTPATALAAIKPFFEQASSEAKGSLEAVVNTIGDLLQAGTTVDVDDRDGLYTRLQAIDTELHVDPYVDNPILKPQYQNLRIAEVNSLADAVYRDDGDGYAYRYALVNLTPFAIVGSDDLYAPHNINNELDLYNEATREGTLTQSYLDDRATFLSYLTEFNLTDTAVEGQELLEFSDKETTESVTVFSTSGGVSRRFLFGGDGNDVLDEGGGR